MATKVLKNAKVSIGGVAYPVKSLTLNYSVDTPEKTQMGDDTHLFQSGGLKNWDASFEANNDYGSGGLDGVIFAAMGTEVAFEALPENAAVGVSNPKYSGTAIVTSSTPFANGVGELATISVSLTPASVLTRATA